MRSIIFIILSIVLAQYCSITFACQNKTRIFITQIVNHPALDATVKGIVDELKNRGYNEDNLELKIESAQGSMLMAGQIATKFAGSSADIVIAVATGSAQSLSKYARNKDIKLIFSSVTDPLSAKIVKNLQEPGNNTSGVSNLVPLKPQLELFKKIQPNLKRLGFLYNPSELNSVSLIEKLKVICLECHIVLVTQIASKSTDVLQSATKLAAGCDAIFISNDSTALSALPVIIQAANAAGVPVYVSDTDAVKLGAVAALGPNQYDIGRQTAKMAIDVLSGADINKMPIQFPTNIDLYLNPSAALKVGLIIPDDVLAKATKVICTQLKF